MGKQEVRKTWREWNADKIGGINILDPDGFERGDPMMNMYVYTRDEFLMRRMSCTVEGGVSPLREGVKRDSILQG